MGPIHHPEFLTFPFDNFLVLLFLFLMIPSTRLPHEKAHGSLRLTVSHETTMDDAKLVCDNLPKIVERLRSMSPLYEDFVKKSKK